MSADDMFSSTLPDLKGLMKKLDAMNEKQNSAMIKGTNDCYKNDVAVFLYLFAVSTAVLAYNNFSKGRIRIFYIYRVLKFFLINKHYLSSLSQGHGSAIQAQRLPSLPGESGPKRLSYSFLSAAV